MWVFGWGLSLNSWNISWLPLLFWIEFRNKTNCGGSMWKFKSDTLERECPPSILSILCNFILLNLHHFFGCPVLLQPSSCCFGGSTWSESRQGSAVWYSTWAMTAMTLIRCFSDALIADANKAWRLKFLLVWCCGLTCIWFPSRVVWYNWASNRAV